MRAAALLCNLAAVAAAVFDGKLLLWDLAVGDLRQGNGGVPAVIGAAIVSAAFVALPLAVGLRWANAGRASAALATGMASLALSAAGFVILAAAFTP